MRTSYDIILRPIVSEQSMEALDLLKYVFEVDTHANKIEIKNAVEEIFGVKVDKVTTSHVKGKSRRQGRYPEGYAKDWKKAVVRLKPGSKTIEMFEGMV
ncbi:MAG: 50S ribosomal protein L23 [Oscillospiraceae bacterium]|jgi:large subunit ribosomal protein L23|nr:50S ribosomal protein L23 [Oscillospiraceae bacterium]